jgi:hypothetical protein
LPVAGGLLWWLLSHLFGRLGLGNNSRRSYSFFCWLLNIFIGGSARAHYVTWLHKRIVPYNRKRPQMESFSLAEREGFEPSQELSPL